MVVKHLQLRMVPKSSSVAAREAHDVWHAGDLGGEMTGDTVRLLTAHAAGGFSATVRGKRFYLVEAAADLIRLLAGKLSAFRGEAAELVGLTEKAGTANQFQICTWLT